MDNTMNVGVKQKAQTVFQAKSTTKQPGMFKVVFLMMWLTEIASLLTLVIKKKLQHYSRRR